MEALYRRRGVRQIADSSESIANILARYAEYRGTSFNGGACGVPGAALLRGLAWSRTCNLIEITAYSDGDAYTIFETMNDRGLSLTPADMLKGYLLANITDD